MVTPWPQCPGGDRSGKRQGTSHPCPAPSQDPRLSGSGPALHPLLPDPPGSPAAGPHLPCPGSLPWAGQPQAQPGVRAATMADSSAAPEAPGPGGTPQVERGHRQGGGGSALMVTLQISYVVRARPLPPSLSLRHSQVPFDPGSAKGDLPPAPAVYTRVPPGPRVPARPPALGSWAWMCGGRVSPTGTQLGWARSARLGPRTARPPAWTLAATRGRERALETAPAAGSPGPAEDGWPEGRPCW